MSGLGRYLKNAIVLVGASLLMRSVSLFFNAYVSGKIGAEGMGLFTLVMSVYGFAVTFATSGINLAVTRLVAAAIGEGREGEVRRILRRAVLYALAFGGTASAVLFFFASPIGTGILGDARTAPSLRLLSVSMVPIALSSVFSGYFVAVRRVGRNAATQLFEQGARIFLTVYGLLALAPAGLSYACLALVGGSALAEFLSFFFLFMQYLFDRRKHVKATPCVAKRRIMPEILHISLPIAFSTYVRSGLLTVEHILIPICLSLGGADRGAALAAYGVLHSMALPVVLFPTAVSSAFSGLLVPEMAEAQARGESTRVRYMTERALGATLLFSMLSAGVLSASAAEIGMLFYGNAEAGRYIRLIAPVAVIMYLDTTVDCILKGLGYQVYSMCVNISDSVLSIALVLLLLPRMGAVGYVAVIALAELYNFSLSILRLHRAVPFRASLARMILFPFLSVVGATSLVHLLLPAAGGGGVLALHVLLALMLYLFLLSLFGTIGKTEATWLFSVFSRKKDSLAQK